MNEDKAGEALQPLLFPHALERMEAAKSSNLKLVHYTSAETALAIIRSRRFWLRNALMMNDFSEIEHGDRCLRQVFRAQLGNEFKAVVDQAHPGLAEEIASLLDVAKAHTHSDTYLASFAAHNPYDEVGKLSMWRAYGGNISGVALVFNSDEFRSENDLNAFTSPVLYGDVWEFGEQLTRVIKNLRENPKVLASCKREAAMAALLNALQFSILSTKHPAFQEEEEWRIIYSPNSWDSAYIEKSSECIRGIPQTVWKIPLEDRDGLRPGSLTLDSLIFRIIIGPCQYPEEAAKMFIELLREAAVINPEERVKISGIPLRHCR